jgi:DNA replication protein DnaC
MRDITQQDLHDAHIPKKYWDACLFSIHIEDYNRNSIENVYKYINNLKNSCKNGLGLLIHSGYVDFTGKTFLACFLAKLFLAHGKDVLYSKLSDLDLVSRDKTLLNQAMNKYFLVIDDISPVKGDSFGVLEKIVAYRYENNKSGVLVLNDITKYSLPLKVQNIVGNSYYDVDLSENTKIYSKKIGE